VEDAERIASIKARIRRSIDDPRPSLTDSEVDERLKRLFADARG
jgi:antitoxin ParD1/3/4